MRSDCFRLAFVQACLVTLACASGGIGGTGTVTGFGSVFVNGIEWFTEAAEITIDDAPGTEADLRIGMVLVFRGDVTGTVGTASELHFDDAIEGPVGAIHPVSPAVKDVEILGETVVLDRSVTVFDDSDPSFAFATVGLDDVLEVSGHVDDEGLIHATWVRRLGSLELGATHVELEGLVSAPSSTGFELGSITIVTNEETVFDEVSESPPAGFEVEVEGTLTAPNTILASDVRVPIGLPEAISEASIEGFVTDFESLASFRVNGQLVDASEATFDPPLPSFVADGVLVEVEGDLVSGVLWADEVELEGAEFEVQAELAFASDFDAAASTLTLAGAELSLLPDAELADELDSGTSLLSPGELNAGDALEATGSFVAGTAWVDVLKRLHEPVPVVVKGPVTAVGASGEPLEIMGVPIPTGPVTEFIDAAGMPVPRAEFTVGLSVGEIVFAADELGLDASRIEMADEVAVQD